MRYLVTSLTPAHASPWRVLDLNRGHWGIETRLFHVKDDSFGEDRHVLQTHAAGATMSLLRITAVNLLRGTAALWTPKMLLTARAEWVCGHRQPSSPPWRDFEKALGAEFRVVRQ